MLLVGGGSNLVVADAGFDGTVVLRPRRAASTRRTPTPAAARSSRSRPARPGTRRRPRRRRGLGRHRGPLRHPGHRSAPPRSRTSAPTARRSPDPRAGAHLGPRASAGPHVRRRRLRLRLPHQPVQAASPDRYVVLVGRRSSCRSATSARPSRTPSWPAPSASRSAQRAPLGRRPRGRARRCGAARAWCSTPRPRHLERRLVLHQPDPDAARPTTLPDGAPRLAAARRHGQDERRLADRARRLRARATASGRVAPVDQAHARADQPRRRHHATCWRWPARCATACSEAFGITLVNEPVLVGCDRSGPPPTALRNSEMSDSRSSPSRPEDATPARSARGERERHDAQDQQHRADDAQDAAGLRLAATVVDARVGVDLRDRPLPMTHAKGARSRRRRGRGCPGSATSVAFGCFGGGQPHCGWPA